VRLLSIDALPELLPPRGYVAPDEVAPAGDPSRAAWEAACALVFRAIVQALAGEPSRALALLDEARAAAAGADAPVRLMVALNRAQALLECGDLAGADDEAAGALRLARGERRDRWAALAGLCVALVHLARGRRGDARTRLGEAVRLFARGGDALRQLQCHYLLGEIAYLAEDPIRAGSHYRDALGIARAAREQAWIELLTLRFEHR
jgi:ATP/maltotriose-dependent transcriptional regulator MalT